MWKKFLILGFIGLGGVSQSGISMEEGDDFSEDKEPSQFWSEIKEIIEENIEEKGRSTKVDHPKVSVTPQNMTWDELEKRETERRLKIEEDFAERIIKKRLELEHEAHRKRLKLETEAAQELHRFTVAQEKEERASYSSSQVRSYERPAPDDFLASFVGVCFSVYFFAEYLDKKSDEFAQWVLSQIGITRENHESWGPQQVRRAFRFTVCSASHVAVGMFTKNVWRSAKLNYYAKYS